MLHIKQHSSDILHEITGTTMRDGDEGGDGDEGWDIKRYSIHHYSYCWENKCFKLQGKLGSQDVRFRKQVFFLQM